MTIVEAVKEVLKSSQLGMTDKEIYDAIIQKGLYEFPAKNPVAVVNSTIRRHCDGLNFPTASSIKHFSIEKQVGKNTYYTLIKESNLNNFLHQFPSFRQCERRRRSEI